MPQPKKRFSKSRTMMRRANHDKLKAHNVIWCGKCGERRLAHRACPSCGDYNGRQVLAIIER